MCLDANFRLKNQMRSSYAVDPGLGTGWAYFVPLDGYFAYVLSCASDADVGCFAAVPFESYSQVHTLDQHLRGLCCINHGKYKIFERLTVHRSGRMQLCSLRNDPSQRRGRSFEG